jgi:hypothetical protein
MSLPEAASGPVSRVTLVQEALPPWATMPRPPGSPSARPRGPHPPAPTAQAWRTRAEHVRVDAGRGRAAAERRAAWLERRRRWSGAIGCQPAGQACYAGSQWSARRSGPPHPPPPPRRRSGPRDQRHVPTGSSSAPRRRAPATNRPRRGTPLRSTRGRPDAATDAAVSQAAPGSRGPRERPRAREGRNPAPGRVRAGGQRREVAPATDLRRPKGRAYGGSEGCHRWVPIA